GWGGGGWGGVGWGGVFMSSGLSGWVGGGRGWVWYEFRASRGVGVESASRVGGWGGVGWGWGGWVG
ncbi:hypothetical protein L9F63_020371, partial [Diploptera punctata]